MGVNGFQVWPSGCAFILSIRLLPQLADQFRSTLQFERSRRTAGRAGQLFEFGVTFPEGRTVDNREGDGRPAGDEAPARPTLAIRGGGSVDQGWDLRWWLWPLPPAGPVTFRCHCPEIRVPESAAVIAGDNFTAAASRAVGFTHP